MLVVSFDAWGTLIKGNPRFLEEKIKLTKSFCPNSTEDEIHKAYSTAKKDFNAIIEVSGWQPPKMLLFQHLFSLLGADVYIPEFIVQYEKLALEHPPLIYSEETPHYLKELSKFCHLIVVSNTMFISGSILRKAFEKLGISQYFIRFHFSDQWGMSKPDNSIFTNSRIHIGDNPLTDGKKSEIRTPFLINSNDKTISHAYHFITQR